MGGNFIVIKVQLLMLFMKKWRTWISSSVGISLILLFGVFLYVYSNYFIYMGDRLHEYGDSVHHVWQIDYVSTRISQLNFLEALSLPHYYPMKYTLLFSDTLIPQAIMVLPFRLFTSNPFALFNIVVLTTQTLNIVSSVFLARSISKNRLSVLLMSFGLAYNPSFTNQIGHLPMVIAWPLYFLIGFFVLIYKNPNIVNKSKKRYVALSLIISLLLVTQLLSGAYLFIMAILPLGLLFLISVARDRRLLRFYLFVFALLLLFLVPFSYATLKIRKSSMPIPYSFYITQSAALTDYVYPPRGFVWSNNKLFNEFRLSNPNRVGEKGFYPPFLIATSLLLMYFGSKIKLFFKNKKGLLFASFVVVAITAFILSLGPRLLFNNVLSEIRLPYILLMKIPLLKSMRVPSRCIFLLLVSLPILYGMLIDLVYKKSKRISFYTSMLLLSPLFFSIPSKINLPERMSWPVSSYSSLPEDCRDKTLLELPNNSSVPGRIGKYKKHVLLSTEYHNCHLINGYSSTLPRSTYETMTLLNAPGDDLPSLLDKFSIDFVKINKNEELTGWKTMRDRLSPYILLCQHYHEDDDALILDCSQINRI